MRSIGSAVALIAFTTLIPSVAGAADQHVQFTPDQLRWGPAPPMLSRGAELAVLAGDPTKPGAFVMRLRLPDGYRVPPHWHTRAENLTVVSGNFALGMGGHENRETATRLGPGGFARMPGHAQHFAWCEGGCIVQIHGTGPFDLHYVNPADNPQRTAAR